MVGDVGELEPARGLANVEWRDRLAIVVVSSAFVALAAGLGLYFYRFARNVPYMDDWELVAGLAGHEPITFSWLYTLQNEHRLPLARAIIFALFRLTGDLRSVMLVTIVLHAAVAWALVRTARAVRGRTSVVDAIFPLALMTYAHAENLVTALQVFFVAPCFLVGALVATAVRDRWRGSLPSVVVMGVALLALPLNGATGVLMSAPALVWVAAAAVERYRAGDRFGRRDAFVLAVALAATLALVGVYLAGYESRGYHPDAFRLGTTLATACQALSMTYGPAGIPYYPATVLVAAIPLAVGGVGALAALRRPDERLRALSLVCGLGGVGLAIGAIGYGRAGFGPTPGFADRYTVFGATALCFAALAIVLYARRAAFAVVGCAVVMLVWAFPANYDFGKRYGYSRAVLADSMTREARRNVPPAAIGARYAPQSYPSAEFLASRLEMLRQQGSSLYARVDTSSWTRVEPEPIRIAETNQVRLDGDRWVLEGVDPSLVVALSQTREVVAVDVSFVLEKPSGGQATLQAFWKREGAEAFDPQQRTDTYVVPSSGTEQTVTIWVNGIADRLRLDPDSAPGSFELRGIRVRVR